MEIIASTPKDVRSVFADFLYDQGKDLESEAMRSGMWEEMKTDFTHNGVCGIGRGDGGGMGDGRWVDFTPSHDQILGDRYIDASLGCGCWMGCGSVRGVWDNEDFYMYGG